MTHPSFSPSRRAFTLVELLVVITIIAVLAGIAVPVYSKVKERAAAIQCGNNLRQLGMGAVAFAGDNDGDLLVDADSTKWTILLRNTYVSDNNIFQSPFDRRVKDSSSTATEAPVSYGANSDVINDSTPRNMDDARYPSQLILFTPVMSSPLVFSGTFATPAVATSGSNAGNQGGTHNGGRRINVVMLDGHIETINMTDFHDSTTDKGKNRWLFQSQNPNG